MLRFIATIVLTVFTVGSNATCTVQQYQELMTAYSTAAISVPTDGSVTTGEQYYAYVTASLTDSQKQYPCLSCLHTYTVDLFNLQLSGPCLADSTSTDCQNAENDVVNAFISCSMENTRNARVLFSGALSVLLVGAALIL